MAQARTYTRRDPLFPSPTLFPSPGLYPDQGAPGGKMAIPPNGQTLDLTAITALSPYTTADPEIQGLLRLSGLFVES